MGKKSLTDLLADAAELSQKETELQQQRAQAHRAACDEMKKQGIRECSITLGGCHVAVRRSGMTLKIKALPCADGGGQQIATKHESKAKKDE